MSYADGLRICAIETAINELRDMVADLHVRVAALQAAQPRETSRGTTGGSNGVPLTQRASSAPVDDAALADVVAAIHAGQSIRGAANMLNINRNKVARLRQRAIATGCLAVSPDRDMTAGSRSVHARAS